MNGEKYLIRGNHDHKPDDWYIKNLGFSGVYNYIIMENVLLTHYPLKTNEYQSTKEVKNILSLSEIAKKNNIEYVIHGHTHNKNVGLEDHYNVSVEAIDYTPIEIHTLLNLLLS